MSLAHPSSAQPLPSLPHNPCFLSSPAPQSSPVWTGSMTVPTAGCCKTLRAYPTAPSPLQGTEPSWGQKGGLSLSPAPGLEAGHDTTERQSVKLQASQFRVQETSTKGCLCPLSASPSPQASTRVLVQQPSSLPSVSACTKWFLFLIDSSLQAQICSLAFLQGCPCSPESLSPVSVSVVTCPATPGSLPMLPHEASSWRCLWPQGDLALAVLVGVGSRPSQKGFTAAEFLSIFLDCLVAKDRTRHG